MKSDQPSPVERLIQQMDLEKPSEQLDQSIETMTSVAVPQAQGEPIATRKNLPWSSIAATALVCLTLGAAGGWNIRQRANVDATDQPTPGDDVPRIVDVRASEASPLHQLEVEMIDEGFMWKNGRPSRSWRIVTSETDPESKVRVREKVIMRSEEI